MQISTVLIWEFRMTRATYDMPRAALIHKKKTGTEGVIISITDL